MHADVITAELLPKTEHRIEFFDNPDINQKKTEQ